MSLDRDYPQGNPEALFCRHCQAPRLFTGIAYMCRTCDGHPDGGAAQTAEANGRFKR
jgi:hypothetical protein